MMEAVCRKCYFSNISKIILFNFFSSSYTFQSYEGSSRSSTLSSTAATAINKPLMGTRVLPPRNHRLIDIESNPSSAYYR